MSGNGHRAGKKIRGSHTTLIPASEPIVDAAQNASCVEGIILGYIKTGLRPSRGKMRVKIGFGDSNRVLLQVRGNTSQQEIHLLTSDIHEAKHTVAKAARNKDIAITFEKKEEGSVS